MPTQTQVTSRNHRKSSQRKVGMSGSGFGRVPKFTAQTSDWETLERAIGCALKQKHRDRISEIVDSFLYWSTAAEAAPYAKDVEAELLLLRDAAKELRTTLTERTGAATSVAHSQINVGLSAWPFNNNIKIDDIARISGLLQRCCNQKIEEIKHAADGMDEHRCWRDMVVSLLNYFHSAGLPATVSATQETASRFVVFIEELQKLIPAEIFKKSQHSRVALAQEIKRARKEARDKKLDAEQLECPDGTSDNVCSTPECPE